ncbi:MAG: hypothetical protein Q9214_001674 [Letrouitia sp. 1 TL-2023]
MASFRNAPSAEYISLQSHATSSSSLSYSHAVGETTLQEVLPAPSSFKSNELDHRKKTWSLLFPQTVRWLGTVTLSALLISVFRIYEKKGNFTHKDKNSFNIIVTGLSVGLGINFFVRHTEAFKESAKGLRWRILADERYSVREVDLILAIESLWKVFLLAMESMSSRPWAILACTAWIAQISVALVTLTFDMVDGRTFNDTYTIHGIVNASNLTTYYTRGSENWRVSAHATAHSYGERAHDTECGSYETIAEVLKSKHDYAYYCSKSMGNPEFTYRFNEYNPGDIQKTYPRFTDRTITASAGECLVYEVKNKTNGPDDVDGRGPGRTFFYSNDTFTDEIQIPVSYLGVNYTTYIYRDSQAPPNAHAQTCGDPRCMWLWALISPKIYQCPITISPVISTHNDSQIVTDGVARIAAVSIALEGRWTGGPKPKNRNFRSYQYYPLG